MLKFKIGIFGFLIFGNFTFLFAQELPPILNFSKEDYKGGNQNWMISESESNFIYVANNKGLVEYDGARWTVYESPNKTIIRSVKVVKERIYTGSYRDFGYWEKGLDGNLVYTSLTKAVSDKIRTDEQFWNILDVGNFVIFQSLNHLFIYDTEKKNFQIITAKNSISKVFKINNSVFYQAFGEGIFEVVKGDKVLISNEPILKESKVVALFMDDNSLTIHTQYEGVHVLKNGILNKIKTSLPSINLYSSLRLSNGNYVMGTVSNGVFIVKPNYDIIYHIQQIDGLANNTVLSLYEDKNKNIWLGLDNGISCININSNVLSYVDNTGFLGTVYASAVYDGFLYLGTNQGLFAKKMGSRDDFTFVENTKGQVWTLFEYDGTLFCGHDLGLFTIDQFFASSILKENNGSWSFCTTDNPHQLIVGRYEGLDVIEKKNGKWNFRNKIQNFDISSRFLERLGDDIYINHEYKGIIRLTLDKDLRSVKSINYYKKPEKGIASSISKFNGILYYASQDGFFYLDSTSKEFKKDNKLSKIIEKDKYVSGKLVTDDNSMWMFGKDNINQILNQPLSKDLEVNSIPISYSFSNAITGYENIRRINTEEYLIGTSNGYLLLNKNKTENNSYQLFLTSVTVNKSGGKIVNLHLKDSPKLKNRENNIGFYYTIPSYSKMLNVEFSYRLEGSEDDKWSKWGTQSFMQYNNLTWGNYIFQVKGRVGYNELETISTYSFEIRRPWYISNLAILIYLFVGILVGFIINRFYKKYYERQNEKIIVENKRQLEIQELESSQYIMKLKNEQLYSDIENKNRELANSTMNLINKNELLSNIQKHLDHVQLKDANIKEVMKIIKRNLNGEDTWNMFEETFNNADKDFLKKIKEIHPVLTPNDLKLCAYLRLNLTSKEIASLLNISVRSVEVKRYRLRKKLNLEHEDGLIDYIISL